MRFTQKGQKGTGMLTENVLNALTLQMNNELTNYYVYKNFSGIADFCGLNGAEKWFDMQANEEKGHFEKFYKYISDQGHVPHLMTIPEQIPEIVGLDGLFLKTVALEAQTTSNIRQVATICKEENDDQTYELILWYLKEQVEEEDMVRTLYQRVIMSMNNLLRIDQELGAR
jgi:ferritin